MKMLVTGGGGFLGAPLCAKLLAEGHEVRALDDYSRGRPDRLASIADRIEIVHGDVRDMASVREATRGCEMVWHLASVNGTRFFYERPDVVVEVAIKGALHTIEAALAEGVRRYVLFSSSEVYQTPTAIPTPETERLIMPDVHNPRFSYGGGKMASELLALHLGGRRGLEPIIFRPHNFYGPDMGNEHVVPELIRRIYDLSDGLKKKKIDLPIQGDGTESRSFCYVDDGVAAAAIAGLSGTSGEIYHGGTEREVTISWVASELARILGVEATLVPGEAPAGATRRRCPSIEKLGRLGYRPAVELEDGLRRTVEWFLKRPPEPKP